MGREIGEEIENARLVLERISNPNVRDFARNILDVLTEGKSISLKTFLKEVEIIRQYEEVMKIREAQKKEEEKNGRP